MNLSPAFHHLRAAYQAEMDDLSFDSEGRDVLRQRLADKRKSLDFLLQMTELSPEMVAVVFHQAFRFTEPGVMNQVVSGELDECPDWDEISASVQIAPWAQGMAETFLQQADGQRFMTVAAALAYLYDKPDGRAQQASDEDEDGDEEGRDRDDHDDEDLPPEERDDDEDARARDEAGADWLAEQGFDRKD
ncbi:MAG: hypothetical protein HY019_18960 [Aquabacterium sp.]|uniref:hypothetical protein n=1 Tax=Aquabacterium sp. TaxID=1872578 RepID=UPI0025BF8CA9|nr:hypothetical protein [Aquabacterium sp.]MBI3384088.1 hypothetical protein [Aquabacterium sp.]